MSSPEPIVFVPTGKMAKVGDHIEFFGTMVLHEEGKDRNFSGYRLLPPGWLAEAVERIKRLIGYQRCSKPEPGQGLYVTDAEIIAALFPPPEPEPEPWMREAAESCWKESAKLGRKNPIDTFARIIAKHAGRAK